MSNEEYAQLRNSKLALENKAAFQQSASKLGLVVMSNEEFKTLSARKPTQQQPEITADRIKDYAASLGLGVLPIAELESLKSEQAVLKDTRAPPATVSRTPAYYHVQAGVEYATDEPQLRRGHHSSLPSVSESLASTGTTEIGPKETTRPGALSRSSTMSTGGPGANISQATIASNASLSDRSMIPYITQVVIGEYLFKYTRNLTLSGISGNRHERYFWIHPYTLTLYWSKDNPALDVRHNNKAKSAAIVSVRSINDRNPLPTGLYYKSLLIQTPDRFLKITCPNRQRHNIWFNTITYLLQRSTDGLTFDDEEPGMEYAELAQIVRDKRLELNTARGINQQRSQRVLSVRRSLAPELNTNRQRAPSRQSITPTPNLGATHTGSGTPEPRHSPTT
jgi:nuclear migration protein NUM1